MKTILKAMILCVICAATLMSGCLESVSEPQMVYVESEPTPKPTADAFVSGTGPRSDTFPTSIPNHYQSDIDNLLNDIIDNDVANKDHYTHDGGAKDVHVCGNMACEQAEWIEANYEYDVGVTLLWSKFGGVGHAQTWVIIDDERYILESTYHEYWDVSAHKDEFGDEYKICFNTIKKGREHTKSSSEYTRTGK